MGQYAGKAIKLVRWGFSKHPFYVLTVSRTRIARNAGRRFEDVGWWDPSPAGDGNMHLGLKFERIKFWLASGAKPTDKVSRLFERVGLIPEKPQAPHYNPKPENVDTKWRPDLLKKMNS
ncbi:MAG: hypothetical protein WDW36_006207 [Sanguina aurantia]